MGDIETVNTLLQSSRFQRLKTIHSSCNGYSDSKIAEPISEIFSDSVLFAYISIDTQQKSFSPASGRGREETCLCLPHENQHKIQPVEDVVRGVDDKRNVDRGSSQTADVR